MAWEVILEVKNKGNEDDLMKFIAMAWGLWYKRNKFIYDNSPLQFSSVLSTALSMQSEFKQVQILNKGSRELPKVLSWKPPPEGSLKIDVDGAIFYDINKAGVGVVLRDQAGRVLVACSKSEPAVPNPEFIEVTAMLRGLQFRLQWGTPKVLMETDCLFLVKALNPHSENLTEFAYVLAEIKRLMLYFQEITFVHVSRQGNNVAHCLAKYARNIDDVITWWDECPSFVSQAVWLDRHMLVRT